MFIGVLQQPRTLNYTVALYHIIDRIAYKRMLSISLTTKFFSSLV